MNRLIVRSIVIFFMSLGLFTAFAVPSMAEDPEICTQVTQYGGGVGIVCGAKHEPVDTGLADINPLVLSLMSLTVSGLFYLYSTKNDLKIRGVTNK